MHNLDDTKPPHQQTTVPMSAPPVARIPSWPPPPRVRPPQGPSRSIQILLAVLATVLVFGGLGLLIYSTTTQYSRALGAQNGSDATAAARGILNAQATRSSRATRTAVPLQTADAQIYATATAQAGPAATATAEVTQSTATAQNMVAALTKVTGGTPTLDDPLSDNSKGDMWDAGYTDNNNTGCNFVNGTYQVLEALTGFLRPCFADATNFDNFVYQVSITANSDCAGGVLLRGNKNAGKYYLFTVNTNGSYQFEIYTGNTYTSLAHGTSSAILGVGQANTLAVIANQGVFDLFINQTYIAEVIDGQLSAGQIGVIVYNTSLPASASFSNAEVWKI